MRGVIPTEVMDRIASAYPNSVSLSDSVVSVCYPLLGEDDRETQSAQVRLEDGWHMLNEARVALIEAEAHRLWYEEYRKPPNHSTAIFFRKFYLDDASLRIYSSGEQLFKTVRWYWRLPKEKGKYLLDSVLSAMKHEIPNHPVVPLLEDIGNSDAWKDNTRYRCDWVHNKRPLIEGLDLNTRRTVTPFVDPDAVGITMGVLQFTLMKIEHLQATVEGANAVLFKTFDSVIPLMRQEIATRLGYEAIQF
ncbi:MAG: hypothetical protein ACRD11_09985 [Terriglobia bacterium]